MKDQYSGIWDPSEPFVKNFLENHKQEVGKWGIASVIESYTGGQRGFSPDKRMEGLYPSSDSIELNIELFNLIAQNCSSLAISKFGSVKNCTLEVLVWAANQGIDPVNQFDNVRKYLESIDNFNEP